MELKFFGKGSGFSRYEIGHTSAWFEPEEDTLVILDLPMSTFYKLMEKDLSKYEKVVVYVTHTHGDHISGLGLFLQYMFFIYKKKIRIVTPYIGIKEDVRTVLRIEGNEESWYKICTVSEADKSYFVRTILTEHSPQLIGKCYGYQFNINGKNIIYTGDTSTLEPFMEYLEDGTELYIDTSVHYGKIHIKLEDIIEIFKNYDKKINIYLMHLDDITGAEKMIKDTENINIV